MYKVDDNLTHINNIEDYIYLKSPLFDVNMRLFKTSAIYRTVVRRACSAIKYYCSNEMEGYKKPHGMSGANAGIPWNIIAYLINRNTSNERCEVMINPKILKYSEEKVKSESNCGSIRLHEPIEIQRSATVKISWYDINGESHNATFARSGGALTLQHEIDHNQGILITDRVVQKEKIQIKTK